MSRKLHNHKIQSYTSIGYELIADAGSIVRLAYVPYNRKYVKLIEIENGKARRSMVLTVQALRALSQRLESAHPLKKGRR